MPKSIETTKLRNNLASAIAEVNEKNDFLIVTKNGDPVAGVVNLDLLEDIEAVNSKAFTESIKEAREQIKRGEVYTHEEVFGNI
ncbi:MAG: type II toxin-antitoxin system prevent-host-death family antitoxin [Candidatus Woykebacteria bacterium]